MARKILIWIFLVALGSTCGAAMLWFAFRIGLYDALPPDDHLQQFKMIYMGGTMWAWVAGSVIGAFSFKSSSRNYVALASMPLALPLIYSITTLIWLMP